MLSGCRLGGNLGESDGGIVLGSKGMLLKGKRGAKEGKRFARAGGRFNESIAFSANSGYSGVHKGGLGAIGNVWELDAKAGNVKGMIERHYAVVGERCGGRV